MLELDNGQILMDDLWETTIAKVQLSASVGKDFFTMRGPTPVFYDNQRSYHRHFMRGKAVLKRGKSMLGAYTKDVSRQGVGFLSPLQLLPKEFVRLHLPTAELSLEVTRCRRVDQGCFDCGARFALEPSLIRSTI
jgi:hypothetical protein